jgi:hypothetical protein
MNSFTLELWQVISLVVIITGAMWGLARTMLGQQLSHLDARFTLQDAARDNNHKLLAGRLDTIDQINREEASQWQRLEREFLRMQADMPLHYVRREDYIRGQSVIEAKLDALGSKLEIAQLRAAANQGNNSAN